MSDQIEKQLQVIADRLRTAWQNNQCMSCPLGELAALAAATLTFYQERQKRISSIQTAQHVDHWTNYRKRHLKDSST